MKPLHSFDSNDNWLTVLASYLFHPIYILCNYWKLEDKVKRLEKRDLVAFAEVQVKLNENYLRRITELERQVEKLAKERNS